MPLEAARGHLRSEDEAQVHPAVSLTQHLVEYLDAPDPLRPARVDHDVPDPQQTLSVEVPVTTVPLPCNWMKKTSVMRIDSVSGHSRRLWDRGTRIPHRTVVRSDSPYGGEGCRSACRQGLYPARGWPGNRARRPARPVGSGLDGDLAQVLPE